VNERKQEVVNKITEYLCNGGLFNPELMNHDSVRDLLIECRELLDNERKSMLEG